MSDFFELSWAEMWANLLRLAAAFLLALPIGWNREARARSAGLRTFPLVSMATCGYMTIGMEVLSSTEEPFRDRAAAAVPAQFSDPAAAEPGSGSAIRRGLVRP